MLEDQFELLRPMIHKNRSRSPVRVRLVTHVGRGGVGMCVVRPLASKPKPIEKVVSFIDRLIAAPPGHDAAISLKGPRAATRAIACGKRTMDDAAKWIEEARRAATLAHCAGSIKSLR